LFPGEAEWSRLITDHDYPVGQGPGGPETA